MERRLVVGVDGSAGSLRAVEWAAREAVLHGAVLRLVHGTAHEHDLLSERERGAGGPGRVERLLASAAERAREQAPGLRTESAVIADDPVDALLAEDRRAWALVTGGRGHSTLAGLLLGSVSLTVAARARCPVFVVRGGEPNLGGTFGRVCLGVGDEPNDAVVTRFAVREAEARRCELHAVRVWRAPAHHVEPHPLLVGGPPLAEAEQASEILTRAVGSALPDDSPATLHREVLEGSPRKVLLALSALSDLLVVGAVRTGSHTGLQLGRVGHTVLHQAECPVAVIPRPA